MNSPSIIECAVGHWETGEQHHSPMNKDQQKRQSLNKHNNALTGLLAWLAGRQASSLELFKSLSWAQVIWKWEEDFETTTPSIHSSIWIDQVKQIKVFFCLLKVFFCEKKERWTWEPVFIYCHICPASQQLGSLFSDLYGGQWAPFFQRGRWRV